MNINIAFNTIIYIMVFLFPGILFRRAFFSGDFNKHFESGNTFERLLWNMLTSILMLVAFCLSIHFCNLLLPFKIEFDLKTSDITDTFICIYENKLPTLFISETRIIQTISLLFSIYSFSILLGYFSNRIIFYLGLEKRFSVFQFQNNWHYLTNSNKQNNITHSIKDIYYTKVDIKTKAEELFTGKLHVISYDKEGKIEAITLQEAYKFYRLTIANDLGKINEIKQALSDNDPHIIFHSETSNNFIYRKRIKGDLFTIFNNDLENISITYIKISNFYEKFQKTVKTILSIIILTATIFSISYAIWDFKLIPFSSYYKRLTFCITSPLILILLILFLISIFDRKLLIENRKKYKTQIKEIFCILILLSLPYLYIFDIVRFIFTLIIIIIYLSVLGKLLGSQTKNSVV
ncbi:hypothetical protein [Flavobacterium ajazii]|uniref:hypothetical protein n=1 Tax=Flavobacterium ajazii TaxID=2692318 RepID=UPI0013D7DE44|nr:hypothetical protein [Flavobacterium ajazii]